MKAISKPLPFTNIMIKLTRVSENPILSPNVNEKWEEKSTFNGCCIKDNAFHMVYRAESSLQPYLGNNMKISSIGYALSRDGIHFTGHKQLIKPEKEWEIFGCEDPRITKIGDKFFIFYTALSKYPFSAEGIKVGLGITKDLNTIDEKHLITPFNAKAMSLFPEKINGKFAAILTVNTDRPPSKICLAFFDKEEELWSEDYWNKWYMYLEDHVLPLQRDSRDQVEVGAPPIKTKEGWLLIHSYIRNYFSNSKIFGIEATLLDLNDPTKIIWRTKEPLLTPEKSYELYGNVPNIVFPSGALIDREKLLVYYGAADTTCCLATCDLSEFSEEFSISTKEKSDNLNKALKFKRYIENPIITPIKQHSWESRATFNPAAIYEAGKIHILYRAMSDDNTSVFGYANTNDGFHIDERVSEPVYIPREDFEKKKNPGNSGCEDPRITKIDDRFYMFYTAFDGQNPPRVAMTSIKIEDFINKNWTWDTPKVISPPGIDDKDSCIFSRKINDKYVILHRLKGDIDIDYVENLNFEGSYVDGQILMGPRKDKWDNGRIGITAPPIETENGWVLIYHGISDGYYYKIGAVLLEKEHPENIISRLDYPLLEPEMEYEKVGEVANVVFPCGALVIKDDLFIYYGGADKVVGVATISFSELIKALLKAKI